MLTVLSFVLARLWMDVTASGSPQYQQAVATSTRVSSTGAVLAMVFTMIVAALLSEVAPPLAVPSMIVFETAVAAFPVTRHIASAGVVWLHPIRAYERWARPVSVVPSVVIALRVPVAFDPFEFR